MSISAVNYQETFFPKPDLTRILGIPTYNSLHQMQLELNSNALCIQSNLGGGTYGHLGILMTNTKYAILSHVAYSHPVHPGIQRIPNNTTHVASYKLKIVYGKNILVFHEVRGVEQELIQKVVTAVAKQYIISMKNRTTVNFTGNIRQIFAYLLSTYRKISPSHLKSPKNK